MYVNCYLSLSLLLTLTNNSVIRAISAKQNLFIASITILEKNTSFVVCTDNKLARLYVCYRYTRLLRGLPTSGRIKEKPVGGRRGEAP